MVQGCVPDASRMGGQTAHFLVPTTPNMFHSLQAADRAPLGQEAPGEEGAVGIAGRKTLETVTAADEIIEALDLAADEEERFKEFEQVGREREWGGLG